MEIKDQPCSFKLSEITKKKIENRLNNEINNLEKLIKTEKDKIDGLESEITQLHKRKQIEIPVNKDLIETDVFNEKQTGTKATGELSGNAQYIRNAHIRLTSLRRNALGHIYWEAAAGTNWKCTFEWRAGGGTNADATWFFVYQDELPGKEFEVHGGYNFVCDEWDSGDGTYGNRRSSFQIHGPYGSDSRQIQTAGGYITHVRNNDFNMSDARWRKVEIFFNHLNPTTDHMQFFVNGKKYIDIKHTMPIEFGMDYDKPKLMGFGARTGNNFSYHDVRNMRFIKYSKDTNTEKEVDDMIVRDIARMEHDLAILREDNTKNNERLKIVEKRLEDFNKTSTITLDGFILPKKNRFSGLYSERLQEGDFVGNMARCYAPIKDDKEFDKIKDRINNEFGDRIKIERRDMLDRIDKKTRHFAEARFLSSDIVEIIA